MRAIINENKEKELVGLINYENELVGLINYGDRGPKGASVVSVEIQDDNSLIFTLSDGTTIITEPIHISGSATDYSSLRGLPTINNITLVGNKNTADLHIDYDDIENVPTNVSDFENDENYQTDEDVESAILAKNYTTLSQVEEQGYIKNSVANLINYYTKAQTYTQEEVRQLIAGIQGFHFVLVAQLPTPTEETTHGIYLVPSPQSKQQNVKDEYITILVNNVYQWEQIGSTATDLTGYATETWVENKGYAVDSELADVSKSGDYEDLINTPTIPTVPTNVSAFTNDAGYLTEHQSLDNYATKNYVDVAVDGLVDHDDLAQVAFSGSYTNLSDKPTTLSQFTNDTGFVDGTYVGTAISGKANTADLADVATTGDYEDLINTPTLPSKVSDLTNDSGYITNSALTGLATETYVNNHHDNTKANSADLATVATTGSYNDLANKPSIPSIAGLATQTYVDNAIDEVEAKIPTIPTTVSSFTNDAGYLTQHQSLSAYRTSANQDLIDAGKQDTLTAGNNISIVNNVISAENTIYTAGDNITIDNFVISADIPEIEVIDNTTSTSTTSALSAKQGKLLNDRIDNISTIGKFLSIWNCGTGLPETNPATLPYTYHTGDYYIVGNTTSAHSVIRLTASNGAWVEIDTIPNVATFSQFVAWLYNNNHRSSGRGVPILRGYHPDYSGAVWYDVFNPNTSTATSVMTYFRPSSGQSTTGLSFKESGFEIIVSNIIYEPVGSSYNGTPSTTVIDYSVSTNDVYYYDGTGWKLQINHSENAVNDVKVDGVSVVSGGIANITLPTVPTNVSDFTNDAGYITSSAIPTAVSSFTNDSGYQTASQVNTAITGKGYQTASDVNGIIDSKGFITNITSGDITTALGFTPYNATNPNGYQTASQVSTYVLGQGFLTGIDSADVENALGYTPYNSSNPSGYQTSTQVATAITNGISGKQDTLVSGTSIKTINNNSILGSGNLSLVADAKINNASIVSNGVATIPLTSTSTFGVMKVGNGLSASSGTVSINPATQTEINAKTESSKPITPNNLNYAIEKGLGNNTLSWTSTEKSNARTTLGMTSQTVVFTLTDGTTQTYTFLKV